jgi:hypothetical protein
VSVSGSRGGQHWQKYQSVAVARALAIIEGVGGQLFLAVLVARLLSLYSSRREIDGNDRTWRSIVEIS